LKKRVAIIAAIIVLLFAFALTACKNKKYYVDPAGNTMIPVTDESNNTILNSEGNIIVYQTNENGDIETDESGVPRTLASVFPERIIDGRFIQTPTYTLTLPSGWSVDESTYGVYRKKSSDASITIDIVKDYTLQEYYDYTVGIIEQIKETKAEGTTITVSDDTFEYVAAKTTAKRFVITIENEKGESLKRLFLIFEINGNIYKFLCDAPSSDYKKANFPEFFSAINYKNYKYY